MRRVHIALFFIGVGSLLSQILLVRELLVSFYGNELSIGIIYAGWLVWIGVGSAWGNRILKLQRISWYFRGLLLLVPLVTFLQILAAKFVRFFLAATTGEFLSMVQLIVFSCILLSVGCTMWGMLFTLGARLLSSEEKNVWMGVNKAYVLEAMGSVAGGLLFSFLLGSVLSTGQLLVFVALITWNTVVWLICARKEWIPALFFIGSALLYAVLLSPIRTLEQQINSNQWSFTNSKLTFVRSIDTRYQHLALLRLDHQHTVYADGRPVYTIPSTFDAEVFAHTIMVHRSDAKRMLVLGGGFNGLVYELLKYPIRHVDYLEIDPELLPFVRPVLSPQNQQALLDPRVTIVHGDGRAYVESEGLQYDVIFLNVGEPSTASLNRYFTLEFFQHCASRLTSDGMLAFSFPSSAEYLANEMKDLNASVYHTLKCAFSNIVCIPGTHAIFIGSSGRVPFELHPDSLAARFARMKIPADFFSEFMFEELMPLERIRFFRSALESAPNVRLNRDSDPVTYYFDLLLWNRFLQGDNTFLKQITPSRIFTGAFVCMVLLVLFFLGRGRFESRAVQSLSVRNKQQRTGLAMIMSVVGLAGMGIQLLLLLNFQETFGSVYEMVGAMTAANMFGLALGAAASRILNTGVRGEYYLSGTLIVFLGIALALPSLLGMLIHVHIMAFTLFAAVGCGSLIGMVFAVVNQSFLTDSRSAGSVYAYDVLGSSIGALVTCSILLPIMGIQWMAFFLAMLILPAIFIAFILRASKY